MLYLADIISSMATRSIDRTRSPPGDLITSAKMLGDYTIRGTAWTLGLLGRIPDLLSEC